VAEVHVMQQSTVQSMLWQTKPENHRILHSLSVNNFSR